MVTKKKNDEAYRSAKQMRDNHSELQVMHSDVVVNRLIEAQNMEDAMKLDFIELLAEELFQGDIEKGKKYWEDHYEKKLTDMLNELDKGKKEHKDSTGWFHLLNFTQRAIGNRSIRDFVPFARQEFDPVFKESNFTPDERKRHDLVRDELEGFNQEVKNEFGDGEQSFTKFKPKTEIDDNPKDPVMNDSKIEIVDNMNDLDAVIQRKLKEAVKGET